MGKRRCDQAHQGGARAIAASRRRRECDYALILRLRPTPSATFARLCRFFCAASSTWTIADASSAFMRSILAATAKMLRMNADDASAIVQVLDAAQKNLQSLANVAEGVGRNLNISA